MTGPRLVLALVFEPTRSGVETALCSEFWTPVDLRGAALACFEAGMAGR